MASKKLGNLIKEARTEAGLTQEQLARRVTGADASDISQAERGLKDLTQEQLKQIAKATGVTQASLLNAAKGSKKTSSSTANKTSMRVTSTEKRLVELYREADSDTKKAALKLLRGQNYVADELLDTLLEGVSDLFKG